jgi:ribose/xylose/arabinose/galactoside ABC-type transport system permease subunit
MILLAVIFHIVLSKTKFGRYTYAVGSNPDSARLSGINVKKHLFKTYIIGGLLAAVAGVLMLCRLKSGVALAGEGYEISAISAVVIGGGSLAGGEGSVAGAMIGALIMCVLSNGLQLLGASSFWQNVFTGIVLIFVVMVEFIRKNKQN